MTKSEKRFLIRSAGQILGPYSQEEVIDFIKRGKISIFDEVTEPFSIWRYLQDHQDFKKIVQSMNVQTRLTNALTQISGKIFTRTKTDTITSTDQTEKLDSLSTNSPTITEIDPEAKKSAIELEVSHQPRSKQPDGAKYKSQAENEEILRKKIGTVIKISWRITMSLAVFIGAYIVYKEVLHPNQEKKLARQAFEQEGLFLYQNGNYPQALPYFERAYLQNILQDQEKLWLSSLYIRENNLQKASSIMTELADSPLKDTGDWFLSKGLLAFFEKDFKSSASFFKVALNQNQKVALLNLSFLNWQSKNHSQSLFYLDELIKMNYERELVFFLQALNLLFQNDLRGLSSHIKKLSHGKIFWIKEYLPEFYFFKAYLALANGEVNELDKAVRAVLNQDPFFEKDYRYNSFIALNGFNWNWLYPYCKNIFEAQSKNSLFNALYGFCYLKMGGFSQSLKYLNQAKNREPKDPLYLALYAYLFMLEGKDLQAEQALSLIDYSQVTEPLPFIIKARYYERTQDWGRALQVYKDMLALFEGHLSALAGVAVSSHHLGDKFKAEVYREKALAEYPEFIRILSSR